MNEAKAAIRQRVRTLLRESFSQRAHRSLLLCEAVRQHPAWKSARTVALFCGLSDEPDLLPLTASEGKRTVFPCMDRERLLWREVQNPVADLLLVSEKSRLLEPRNTPVVALEEIQLLLVPGVAFTRDGCRLGRGGGFYDRTLAQLHPGTATIGVCFSCQIVDWIPMESHDLRVRHVLER